ncbi:MAG: hypothetical protein ACFE91_09030 [Promethearchaeota archaeon]
MDWENFFNSINMWYNIFVEWYIEQPIYGQIFALIGIIALLALLITLIYFIIKGIAYLVYYIFKGLYYLLRYIGYGIYKLFEGFYFLVSGKSKSSNQIDNQANINENFSSEYPYNLEYCSECGKKFSEKMKYRFERNGMVFCVNCGKQFIRNNTLASITISH